MVAAVAIRWLILGAVALIAITFTIIVDQSMAKNDFQVSNIHKGLSFFVPTLATLIYNTEKSINKATEGSKVIPVLSNLIIPSLAGAFHTSLSDSVWNDKERENLNEISIISISSVHLFGYISEMLKAQNNFARYCMIARGVSETATLSLTTYTYQVILTVTGNNVPGKCSDFCSNTMSYTILTIFLDTFLIPALVFHRITHRGGLEIPSGAIIYGIDNDGETRVDKTSLDSNLKLPEAEGVFEFFNWATCSETGEMKFFRRIKVK